MNLEKEEIVLSVQFFVDDDYAYTMATDIKQAVEQEVAALQKTGPKKQAKAVNGKKSKATAKKPFIRVEALRSLM